MCGIGSGPCSCETGVGIVMCGWRLTACPNENRRRAIKPTARLCLCLNVVLGRFATPT